MKILEIRDNGGETFDRYTVVYDQIGDSQGNYEAVGMSEHPFHPQGFGQHCTAMTGKHLGKRIKFSDLPKDCQKLVNRDLKEVQS
jgi:hypothetical protein